MKKWVQFILHRGDTAKRPGCFRRSTGFLQLFICIVVIGCFVSKALSVLHNGAHYWCAYAFCTGTPTGGGGQVAAAGTAVLVS